MRYFYVKLGLVLVLVCSGIYAVNNQYINPLSPCATGPNGSPGPCNVTNYPPHTGEWEPSSLSPTVAGSQWVHSWIGQNSAAFTARWNPTTLQWESSGAITAQNDPGGNGAIGDVFLSYDPTGPTNILVATGLEHTSSSAYFAISGDGKNWGTLYPIICGANLSGICSPGFGSVDYSSVAVDASGNIIVGAVVYQDSYDTSKTWGYWVNIFNKATGTWSGATQVVGPPGPQVANGTADTNRWGINARVAATASHFYVFLPALKSGSLFQPLAVYYYDYDENVGTWTGPQLVLDFSSAPPLNNTPQCIPALDSWGCGIPPMGQYNNGYVYYAPLIDASGSASGTWAVAFQAKTGGSGSNNNVYVCSGSPSGANGCYAVNPYAVDQFMNGVNVDWLGGLWISYVGFSGANYQLPLWHQTIYLPPPPGSGGYTGATGDMQVNPLSWLPWNTQDRCYPISCYAMGDYARTGSNGGYPTDSTLGLDAPYIRYDANGSGQLFQLWYQDPPGAPLPNSKGPESPNSTFTPHPIFYPSGTVLPIKATPNPSVALGVSPEKRRKMPGFN